MCIRDRYSAVIMKVSNALYTWNIITVKVFEQFLCYFFATCDGDEYSVPHMKGIPTPKTCSVIHSAIFDRTPDL